MSQAGIHKSLCELLGLTVRTVKFEMASAVSQLLIVISSAQTRDVEASSASTLSEKLMLGLSSSEELDILSIHAGDLGD